MEEDEGSQRLMMAAKLLAQSGIFLRAMFVRIEVLTPMPVRRALSAAAFK